MRHLGIDYGTKRVGLALSDVEGNMAFPHAVLQNKGVLVDEIIDIVAKENVEQVVIGESKDLDGSRNSVMDDIDLFVAEWKRRSTIPIALEPEFFTSHQAQKIQGMHDAIDASAAAIILQSYIDRESAAAERV